MRKSAAEPLVADATVYVVTADFKRQLDELLIDVRRGWLIAGRDLIQKLRAAGAPIAPDHDLVQCPCCRGIFTGPGAARGSPNDAKHTS